MDTAQILGWFFFLRRFHFFPLLVTAPLAPISEDVMEEVLWCSTAFPQVQMGPPTGAAPGHVDVPVPLLGSLGAHGAVWWEDSAWIHVHSTAVGAINY